MPHVIYHRRREWWFLSKAAVRILCGPLFERDQILMTRTTNCHCQAVASELRFGVRLPMQHVQELALTNAAVAEGNARAQALCLTAVNVPIGAAIRAKSFSLGVMRCSIAA
ncbi:uncharacterized protein B0H18DRAFT_431740 [Fomitopsis serialis]|uniref:uncharacterized protein n=1 Tax=Fomitopsis serialis TaxID=139415 RepID=UPI002008CFDC|nr:uncharacterized protein B0H18DRAFT_431740 [Neoantrodia serialis]KAH9924423.1 hypothetical protein B0H18DRAFT_431740 [Neoantrodia serialis]